MLGTAATSGCPGIRGGRPRPFVGLSAPPDSLGAWFLGPRGEFRIYQSGLMTPPCSLGCLDGGAHRSKQMPVNTAGPKP